MIPTPFAIALGIWIGIVAVGFTACVSRPSLVRFTYYDDHGCAWIQRPGEKPAQLTDASTGEQFCIRERAK